MISKTRIASLLIALFGLGGDTITISTGTAGNAGNVVASLITYLSARLLEVAELNTILDQFGEKNPLPSNSSKTIRFVRAEKFTVSASPTQLTEATAPDAQGLTMNQIEATVEQYGQVVRISDLAELTAKHNVVERTIYLLGLQAAETYDQLVFNVLDAASNNYRPNSRSADTDLIGSDHVAYLDLIKLAAILKDAGARPFDMGGYSFVSPPQVVGALKKDPDWKGSVQFKAPERMWRGEVGMLGGFSVIETNSTAFAATSQTGAGDASKVYSSFAIAKFSYAITDLQNLQTYVTPPGGQTDPLHQNRKLGFKFAFKSVILNQAWIRRVRSAGLDSVTN